MNFRKTLMFFLAILFKHSVAQTSGCSVNFSVIYLADGEVVINTGGTGWSSPSAIISYDFGDGSPILSTFMGSVHQKYPSNGHFLLCVSVSDSIANCNASTCDSVIISSIYNLSPCASAAFNYVDSIGQTNFSLQNYPFGTYTYTIDYGDGTSANNLSSHTYSQTGTYNVCVTLTFWNGASCTYCDSIYAGSNSYPSGYNCKASFLYDSLPSGNVAFDYNSSLHPNTLYTWDFGDGSTSTGTSVLHHYNNNGTYQACLTVTDTVFNCSDSNCVIINVNNANGQNCNALFNALPDSANGTNNWLIVDYSTGNNLTYFWDFGDGSTSTQQYPTHTYNPPGHYTICLTVNDSINQCSSVFCDSSSVYKTAAYTMNSIQVIPQEALFIKEKQEKNEFLLYPNPASDNLNINSSKPAIINIYSIAGELVLSTVIDKSTTLDISALKAGLYIVNAEFSDGQITHKLVINK